MKDFQMDKMEHSKEQNVVNDARCSLTWFENALREIGARKHPLTDEAYKELKEIINKEADKISLALDAQVFENVDYSGWKEQPSIPSEWEFLRDKLVKMHNELDVLYDKGDSEKGLRYAQGVLGYAVMHINAHTAYEHKQPPVDNDEAEFKSGWRDMYETKDIFKQALADLNEFKKDGEK